MCDSTVSTTTGDRAEESTRIRDDISEIIRVMHFARQAARFLKRKNIVNDEQFEDISEVSKKMSELAVTLDKINMSILVNTSSSDDSGSDVDHF